MRTQTRLAVAAAALAALMIADPSAYVLNGPKWGTYQVPFYINPANWDVSASAAIAAVQAGANAWNEQTNANLQLYYMGTTNGSKLEPNGKNEVFFRNESKGSTIAEAYWWYNSSYKLIDADIVFYDGGFKFFTGSTGCSSGLYIEDTATHEFGHAIGLGHSSVAGATMAPKTSYCSMAGRTLDADDIAGLEDLYPPTSGEPAPTPPSNTAPTVSITQPGSAASFTEGTSIAFAGSATDSEDGTITPKLAWTSNLSGQIGSGGSFSKSLPLGTHTITATAFDSAGASGSKQVTLEVTVSTSPTGISMNAKGYKKNRFQYVDLQWSGATSLRVDVYRNDTKVTRTRNDGFYTDATGKRGQATYTYKVCKSGTLTCSNTVTVVF